MTKVYVVDRGQLEEGILQRIAHPLLRDRVAVYRVLGESNPAIRMASEMAGEESQDGRGSWHLIYLEEGVPPPKHSSARNMRKEGGLWGGAWNCPHCCGVMLEALLAREMESIGGVELDEDWLKSEIMEGAAALAAAVEWL